MNVARMVKRGNVMKARISIAACVIAAGCGGAPNPSGSGIKQEHPSMLRGVNLAGADFGEQALPGVFDKDYTYPTHAEVDYFVGKGMNVFRIPFRWERLQPAVGADFDADEQGRLEDIVAYATSQGASVILDPHNYARYYGSLIRVGVGAQIFVETVPTVLDFAALWTRLAGIFGSNSKAIFGLMNEPHDISADRWLPIANAAIAAIRATGATNLILVPGTNWTGAANWYADWGYGVNADSMQGVVDPADNFAFELHEYFDRDGSGTSSDCVTASIGSGRLRYVTAWLESHHARGFLGEFGSAQNATCLSALGDLLDYVDGHADVWAGWTYWAAGPWWSNYIYSIEPGNDGEKPQMAVLSRYF
jgi:endoglucanase